MTVGGYLEYLDLAESEYHTLYRKGRWTKASAGASDSAFTGNFDGNDSARGGGAGRGSGRGGNRYSRKRCHNCGKTGHINRTCWAPGGGQEVQGSSGNTSSVSPETFPGVGGDSLRNPPCPGAPRERTLVDGSEMKWCALCGLWTDYYRAGHPITGEGNDAADDGDGNVVIEGIAEAGEVVDEDQPPNGAFARLRDAGLI